MGIEGVEWTRNCSQVCCIDVTYFVQMIWSHSMLYRISYWSLVYKCLSYSISYLILCDYVVTPCSKYVLQDKSPG